VVGVVVVDLRLVLDLSAAAVVLNVTIDSAVSVMQAHISQAGNAALSQRSRRRLRCSCRPLS